MTQTAPTNITPISGPEGMFKSILRRKLPQLEQQLEQFDLINDHIDKERVYEVRKEATGQGYALRVLAADHEQELGFFASTNSREYVNVMQALEEFISEQGPQPLAMYGLKELPTKNEPFPDPIIVSSKTWRSVDDFKNYLEKK